MGTRAIQKGVFVRGRHFSAEGLLTIDGMVSNTVVEGSMTRAMYLEYLEFSVVCCLISICFILHSSVLLDAVVQCLSRTT